LSPAFSIAPPVADSTAFVSHIVWTGTSPVPGVTLLSGTYTDPSAHPYWTIAIQAPDLPWYGRHDLARCPVMHLR
jgi:hypothetical protein